jgi:hypothetical protein
MRTTFTLQRALVNERSLAGEQNLPPLVTSAVARALKRERSCMD